MQISLKYQLKNVNQQLKLQYEEKSQELQALLTTLEER
jgi:hypothetical protein